MTNLLFSRTKCVKLRRQQFVCVCQSIHLQQLNLKILSQTVECHFMENDDLKPLGSRELRMCLFYRRHRFHLELLPPTSVSRCKWIRVCKLKPGIDGVGKKPTIEGWLMHRSDKSWSYNWLPFSVNLGKSDTGWRYTRLCLLPKYDTCIRTTDSYQNTTRLVEQTQSTCCFSDEEQNAFQDFLKICTFNRSEKYFWYVCSWRFPTKIPVIHCKSKNVKNSILYWKYTQNWLIRGVLLSEGCHLKRLKW